MEQEWNKPELAIKPHIVGIGNEVIKKKEPEKKKKVF